MRPTTTGHLGTAATPPAIDLARALRFFHPRRARAVAILPHPEALDDHVLAALLGVTQDDVERVRRQHAAHLEAAAQQLLADPSVCQALAASPLRPGQRLVCVGDSLTADSLGWAEILRVLFERAAAPGQPAVCVLNAGVSGDTTVSVLERFSSLVSLAPDWVALLLTTNDVRRDGPGQGHQVLSLQETRRTVGALASRLASETSASVVWLTPPPVHEERLRSGYLSSLLLQWRNEELRERAAVVSAQPQAIDTGGAFPDRDDLDALVLDDGLHLSLTGQVLLARGFLLGLAELAGHGS